jgi:hypothetical protein
MGIVVVVHCLRNKYQEKSLHMVSADAVPPHIFDPMLVGSSNAELTIQRVHRPYVKSRKVWNALLHPPPISALCRQP